MYAIRSYYEALEVKNGTVNKGAAANRLLNKAYDFVFAIGDDRTDEFMFRLLPKETITVKVGEEDTVITSYSIHYTKLYDLLTY